jgi:Cu(I)/Ag(I) efflux system protein CusF
MNLAHVFAAISLSLAAVAHAQSDGMKGMDMKGMDMKGMKSEKKAAATVHQATGKVTKVDKAKAAVTIAHDPVASMKWPAMTMGFKVKNKALLEKLKSGENVEFSFVQQGKDYLITEVK